METQQRTDRNETEVPSPRCDNYEDYLSDEQGYAWDARDVVSVDTLERHDDILALTGEELQELVPADYDDFIRWAIARRWHQLDRLEPAIEVARTVVDGETDHRAIHYSEARLAVARLLEEAGRLDEAVEMTTTLAEEDDTYRPYGRLLHAMIRLRSGKGAGGDRAEEILDSLYETHSDDAELQYEIAEDLARSGFGEMAETWIERTSETAERTGNRAVQVDLELLEPRMGH